MKRLPMKRRTALRTLAGLPAVPLLFESGQARLRPQRSLQVGT